MGRRRKRRNPKFEYRRQNPDIFPHFCEICTPQRRFKEKPALDQHDKMKHPFPELATPHPCLSFDYSVQRIHSNLMYSSTSSPLGTLSASELQTFVTNEIEPDTAYNSSCKAVVHRLCQFMQNNFPAKLRPSEVVKSGSLGKGTAVKGKSDADLVVFLSNYDSISSLKQNLPEILKEVETYLGSYGDCTITGKTIHAVQISLSCHANHYHDVDILPTVNILAKQSKSQIYAEMKLKTLHDQGFYSAPLTPLQIEFVSHVPAKVKTLIRLVKYWKKTELARIKGKPPVSYLLELITIGKWEMAGKPQNFELRKGFFHIISALVQNRYLELAWNTNYRAQDYTKFCTVPYVLDPAHPFNNVMGSCKCWEEVAYMANLFLTKELFQGLSSLSGWL
ncbi:2'-5'-oligoadenylate synthase 1A-like [Saccostrea echinata]|uniref:2'-5'-oligoadenylate synthase 1A-like n=1 Tax=Saccostrea echinata TaxID=191078 RepID=UPI002A829132|nr:2'-5'-oligoadenylate synthase 1A-like [Saccostrea echinata]